VGPDGVLPRLLSRLRTLQGYSLSSLKDHYDQISFLRLQKGKQQTCFLRKGGKEVQGTADVSSVSGKIMEQTVLKAMPRHTRNKVTGSSQPGFTEDKLSQQN